jgi:hypothetical protein
MAFLFVPNQSNASIIFDASINSSGAGFGTLPRQLTLDSTGAPGSQKSGCTAVVGAGAGAVGSTACLIGELLVLDANGFVNLGGDEAPPPPESQKNGTPTLGSLGITSAADLGLLFDGVAPGSALGVNILDVTLKLYDATTFTLLGAVDGAANISAIQPGVGNIGFGFRLSDDEVDPVQLWIDGAGGVANIRIALESTIAQNSGGPDSWLAFSLGAPPDEVVIPEPSYYLLVCGGVAGLFLVSRSRRRSRRL